MIFNYKKLESGKVYVFGDLDVGETFMLSDPRKEDTVDFEECPVYIAVDSDDKAINLENGHLLFIDSNRVVYPVICECSVSLYPDVY